MYQKAILASAAVLAFAGLAGTAAAHSINSHVLDVRLPDGSIEQIRYTGNQPPEISFATLPDAGFLSVRDFFGAGSPFADMERISAMMDREADAMIREASRRDRIAFGHPGTFSVDFGDLPPGAKGYSSFSVMSGGNVCTRTMQYDSTGHGKPRVRTSVSGDCSGVVHHSFDAPALTPDRGWSGQKLIEANYHPERTSKAGQDLLAYAPEN